MRDAFYRFMPWVFGIILGWLLFNPPAWLQALGPLSWVVNLAICAVLFLSVISLIILANLPRELSLEDVTEGKVHAELRGLAQRFAEIGFRPAGGPWRVNVAPTAIFMGFVHQSLPVYASAFRTETMPPKVAFDYVSMLHGDRGALTTNAVPDGAVLPESDGSLRQVFPDATPEELFERHLEGIAYLRERGIHVRNVSADTLRHDFSWAMTHQRQLFIASPLRGALVTIWRAATKRVPFLGSLRDQKIAGQQIARLLAS
jgi:hypothetical protein